MIKGPVMTSFYFVNYFVKLVTYIIVLHVSYGFSKPFYKYSKAVWMQKKILTTFSMTRFSIIYLFPLHSFHLLFFLRKFYEVA